MKYPQVYPDEWITPVHRGWKSICCDCGLVHAFDFKIVKKGNRHHVMFRARRDNRATALVRRKKSLAISTQRR